MSDAIRRAEQYYQSGALAEAEQICLEIQQSDTTSPQPWYLLGMIAHRGGDAKLAADRMAQAVALAPNDAQLQTHASEILRRAGRIEEAVAAGRSAVKAMPGHPATHNNLGLALQADGSFDESEACFRRAMQLDPTYLRATCNLGVSLSKRGQLDDAAACYQQVLRVQPEHPQALNGLGVVARQRYRYGEALACFQRSLRQRPDYPQALLNLGNALSDHDRLDEAERALRRALEVQPDYVQALHDLGALMERRKRYSQAVEAYARAVELEPQSPRSLGSLENARRHACDWSTRPESMTRMLAVVDECLAKRAPGPLWPASSLRFPTTGPQRLGIACQYAEEVLSRVKHRPLHAPHDTLRHSGSDGRIRVGFLSHEFGDHIVSYLMQDVYGRLDRKQFKVLGFAYSADDGSELRRRISGECDRFVEVTVLAPEAAARRIADEGVQILVDMNSYMPGGRPEIAAHRPAPVQVSYRYPGTMGADWIDYLLADRTAVPPEHEPLYTECIVRLPEPYLSTYTGQPPPAEGPSRADCGLPEDGFVFGSFNQTHKLDPETFDVWMRILDRVPGSVLWQIENEPAIRDNLRREAAHRGIEPTRLVFAPKVPIREHLARMRNVDLMLDTPVHGAIVTAVDLLWAGVPFLTVLGDTFTSRAPVSLLKAAGVPELAVESFDEYEALAVELARDEARLQVIRSRLADGRHSCPLFDTDRFTQNLEAALQEMWRRYESGQSPQAIDVSIDSSKQE